MWDFGMHSGVSLYIYTHAHEISGYMKKPAFAEKINKNSVKMHRSVSRS